MPETSLRADASGVKRPHTRGVEPDQATGTRRRASIVDVAARAGVSTATVSRTMRGSPSVSAGTRARVLQAADELSYVVSPAASRLASGRTHTIAVLVPFARRWFFSQVVAGAEEVLREAGYDVLLCNVADPTARRRFFSSMHLQGRVDAVLVLALALSEEESDLLAGLGIPVGAVGRAVAGGVGVRIDDEEGAAMAVRHLLHLGHEDIAMISGDPQEGMGFLPGAARLAGFSRTMAEAGAAADLVVTAPWGVEGGAQAMADLLSGPRLPSAVFAESDEMALGALRTLRRSGIDVPRRMSVIGFDDHEMASIADLTTICQPVRQQGATVANLVLDVLAHASTPSEPIQLPTRLVVRGTTAPPAPRPSRADPPE